MKLRLMREAVIAFAVSTSCGLAGDADSVSDFYRRKTIAIQVGYGPGGGYDLTARVIAQFYGEHIPGPPTIIVQNVPGAGSLKLANAIANGTLNDGLTLAVFAFDVALQPYFGETQARFDPAAFAWIGSMDTESPYCGVWKASSGAISSLSDLLNSPKLVSFGSSAPGALPSVYPQFLKNALGAPVRIIYGYPGTKEVALAMRRGEIDGVCGHLLTSMAPEIKSGDLQIFVQGASAKPLTTFPGATFLSTALKTEELQDLAQLVFKPFTITRPLAAPPRTPMDRVEALRRALSDTIKDPRAISAARKQNIGLEPKSAEELDSVIVAFKGAKPELLKKAHSLSRDQ